MSGIFKQKYGLILFTSILAAMGLTYWFGIRTMIETIKVGRDDIQKMLVIRENREHQLSRLAEYDAQYEAITRDEKWLDVFTTRDNMIEFVRRLESLAEEEGVAVILEAREIPKTVNKPKAPVNPKKTDNKGDGKTESTSEATTGKQENKYFSIVDNLPSTTYTYLGLRVIGETKKVIRYLHKVEMLPVALDVISLEAIRRENKNFLEEETAWTPMLNQEGEDSISSIESAEPQTELNPFVVPETVDSKNKSTKNAFELEVTAGLVVYHPKE